MFWLTPHPLHKRGGGDFLKMAVMGEWRMFAQGRNIFKVSFSFSKLRK